jgi:hypothetical protein
MINWLHDASALMQATFLSGAFVVLMWFGIIFFKPLCQDWGRWSMCRVLIPGVAAAWLRPSLRRRR